MQVKKANWFMLAVVLLPLIYQVIMIVTDISLPLWLQLMMGELLILAGILIYCAISKKPLWETIPHNKLKVSTILLIVLFTALVSPLITVVNLLSQFLVSNEAVTIVDTVKSLPSAVLFLIIAVMPALIEEIGFRGILLQNYRENGVWGGILLSALLFGLMHMNLNQMMYATVLGILMALLVEATNSIFSSMLMHFLVNGSNVLILYQSLLMESTEGASQELYNQSMAQLGISDEMFLIIMLFVYGIFAVIGLVIAIPVYKKIADTSGRGGYIAALFRGNVKPYQKERIFTIPLVIAMVCSILYIVLDTVIQMGLLSIG